MNSTSVNHISEWFIKPQYLVEEAKDPYHLTVWNLKLLSFTYSHKGLLFAKPLPSSDNNQQQILDDLLKKLKNSLALTLVHFYPLAGRLVTSKNEQDPASQYVHVDIKNSPGARFIHATANLTISDILSPTYVPLVVESFFDHDRILNHDGHVQSLLTIQVTELIDGIFIGFSMSHCIVDGTSFWHFINILSEIFQELPISCPPIIKPWFPNGYGPIIKFPIITHPDKFKEPPYLLKKRFFHFSSESIAKLKAKANAEYNTNKISSFQSLCALIWRCTTRARNPLHDQKTSCLVACNNRSRLNPPLSQHYFGNCIDFLRVCITANELLEKNLGWAAWQLHQAVVNHTDQKIRERLYTWIKPFSFDELSKLTDTYSLLIASSPRFNIYGNQFGLGKAVAVRAGWDNNIDGKVTCYEGYEGGGSVDVEASLPQESMSALESDDEFMADVSLPASPY